jgi:hypothetical protein
MPAAVARRDDDFRRASHGARLERNALAKVRQEISGWTLQNPGLGPFIQALARAVSPYFHHRRSTLGITFTRAGLWLDCRHVALIARCGTIDFRESAPEPASCSRPSKASLTFRRARPLDSLASEEIARKRNLRKRGHALPPAYRIVSACSGCLSPPEAAPADLGGTGGPQRRARGPTRRGQPISE